MVAIVGRSQLVRLIAEETSHSQKDVSEFMDSLLNNITSTLASGGEIKIPGYLTISSKVRNARTGRNPRTGEEIHIAEKRVPSIRAGKTLKDAAEGA